MRRPIIMITLADAGSNNIALFDTSQAVDGLRRAGDINEVAQWDVFGAARISVSA